MNSNGRLLIFLIPCYATGIFLVEGFVPFQHQSRSSARQGNSHNSRHFVASDSEHEIQSMSVRDIKGELDKLGVSTKDAFEKETLVQRLLDARTKKPTVVSTPTSNVAKSDSKDSSHTIAEVPLYFSTNRGEKIEVRDNASVQVEATHPFATIDIHCGATVLHMLLDTACSGVVLRPSTVQKHYFRQYDNAQVSMTGAGGQEETTTLTELPAFALTLTSAPTTTYGPLPAVSQDIGALPSNLDGILGLSFLSQFAKVEMDFVQGMLRLCPSSAPAGTVLTSAPMKLLVPLGVYTVPVLIGGRGPVSMIVDTGASSTLLSWKGVTDLGLSASHPSVQRIPGYMGAVGSDNVAMQLTHRICCSSHIHLGSSSGPGMSLKTDSKRLCIDIGNIALLDSLADQGVGGILGVDMMMRACAVRFSMRSPYEMTLQSQT